MGEYGSCHLCLSSAGSQAHGWAWCYSVLSCLQTILQRSHSFTAQRQNRLTASSLHGGGGQNKYLEITGLHVKGHIFTSSVKVFLSAPGKTQMSLFYTLSCPCCITSVISLAFKPPLILTGVTGLSCVTHGKHSRGSKMLLVLMFSQRKWDLNEEIQNISSWYMIKTVFYC